MKIEQINVTNLTQGVFERLCDRRDYTYLSILSPDKQENTFILPSTYRHWVAVFKFNNRQLKSHEALYTGEDWDKFIENLMGSVHGYKSVKYVSGENFVELSIGRGN